ncbi:MULTISPECIES: DUF1707 SHOCT-like domain-containing protein [Thermomonosporaceae]|uniref:DUF1707 SHOCT-like domain-containing protein n=1 Tax=Thermomonosporaceae TaxID=2012 RepID=UPI00255ABE7D|nr:MULTISPECIES: DUF1707 domain-containing protein [Thermomonosporaceae]MDL4776277.1 DUF1707 domain-containing protein [Actinomadura xylanilytica]
MAPNPEMRASDADRDRVAASLREHCAQGRITTEELQERIEAVFEARTLGELDQVTADLPEEDLYDHPFPVAQKGTASVPARRPSGGGIELRGSAAMWSAWAAVSGINLTIWLIMALTGTLVFPWWLWIAGPWGVVLLVNTIRARRG